MQRLPDEIESGCLVIRRWTPGDVDLLADAVAANVEHLRPWTPWVADEPLSRPARVALVEKWGADWDAGNDMGVGAFLGGVAVGAGGRHRARGGARRRGLALHGIERVEIHHDEATEASGRIPRRLGFDLVDEVADEPEAPGESGIECRWRLTRAAWSGSAGPGDLR